MFSRLYHFQHTFQHRAYLAGIDETIELQKAHGGGPEFSRPLGSAIVACVCAGAFDRVRAISEEVMPLALATGDAGTVAQTGLFGGMVDTAEGHFAEARTRMNGAVKIYHDTGMPWESAALAAAMGPVILMGDWVTGRLQGSTASGPSKSRWTVRPSTATRRPNCCTCAPLWGMNGRRACSMSTKTCCRPGASSTDSDRGTC